MAIKYFRMNHERALKHLAKFAMDKSIINELGYPITSDDNTEWFCAVQHDVHFIGFCAARINLRGNYVSFIHDYVIKEYRNKGVYDTLFKMRIEQYPGMHIKAVATHKSVSTFMRYGFTVTKTTKNYNFVERN